MYLPGIVADRSWRQGRIPILYALPVWSAKQPANWPGTSASIRYAVYNACLAMRLRYIFVWNEIAMPGDNVQRRMIQRHCPEQPLKLLHDLRRFVAVLIPCLRRFEVASVGKAIGTDGTKLRQTKGLAIILDRKSEERRDVNECYSPCRNRWSP